MLLLTALLGAVFAGAALGYAGTRDGDVWSGSGRAGEIAQGIAPSLALGAFAGLGVAGVASVWSWFGGSRAVLAMVGAREIEKEYDRELFNVVEELSIAAGLPMPRVYLIPESALNAFATGRDPRHAAVAITSGLRARLSRDELQAVMAHEMAHIRHLDIRFSTLMATLVGLIVFACDAFLRIWRHQSLFGGRSSRRGGGGGGGSRDGGNAVAVVFLVLGLVLAIVAPLVAALIQMAYSRQREYLADAGAVELTRNPLAMASALTALSNDSEPLVEAANRGTAHMYIVNPMRRMRQAHQSLDSMFSSHPPIALRIERLMALMR